MEGKKETAPEVQAQEQYIKELIKRELLPIQRRYKFISIVFILMALGTSIIEFERMKSLIVLQNELNRLSQLLGRF